MKIIFEKPTHHCKFEDLQVRDIFVMGDGNPPASHGSNVFMKIIPHQDSGKNALDAKHNDNALSLVNGYTVRVESEAHVVKYPDAELIMGQGKK